MVPAMPCDRAILRFSLGCLLLSLIAGILPIAFPERALADSAAVPGIQPAAFIVYGDGAGGLRSSGDACSVVSDSCGAER